MTQNLAYIIGGAFLLATLLMAGGRMRGFFSAETVRAGRGAALVMGAILLGYAVFNWWPAGYAALLSILPHSASPAPESTPAAPTAAPASARKPAPPDARPAIKIREVEDPTPAPVVAPPSPPAPPTEAAETQAKDDAKPDSRARRLARSAGRILHLGHKPRQEKTDPEQR